MVSTKNQITNSVVNGTSGPSKKHLFMSKGYLGYLYQIKPFFFTVWNSGSRDWARPRLLARTPEVGKEYHINI